MNTIFSEISEFLIGNVLFIAFFFLVATAIIVILMLFKRESKLSTIKKYYRVAIEFLKQLI